MTLNLFVASHLADRLRAASGLRSLIAHRYGAVDVGRLFTIASSELDDLVAFCQQLARQAESSSGS